MTLQEYVDKIYVINLKRRPDRWQHVEEQCRKYNLTVERFEATDGMLLPEKSGNLGNVLSHVACLKLGAKRKHRRFLILEDDFEFITPPERYGFAGPMEAFSAMIAEVPTFYHILFLGGGYGEAPKRRISKHVIECGLMKTATSNIYTWQSAKAIVPRCKGGTIDDHLGQHAQEFPCYIFQPRIAIQYTNVSDLQHRVMDNSMSMLDTHHEEMLLSGHWHDDIPECFVSTINRREIAAPHDLDGKEVIVDGKRYLVREISLPAHPGPWYRKEPISYHLKPL